MLAVPQVTLDPQDVTGITNNILILIRLSMFQIQDPRNSEIEVEYVSNQVRRNLNIYFIPTVCNVLFTQNICTSSKNTRQYLFSERNMALETNLTISNITTSVSVTQRATTISITQPHIATFTKTNRAAGEISMGKFLA